MYMFYNAQTTVNLLEDTDTNYIIVLYLIEHVYLLDYNLK